MTTDDAAAYRRAADAIEHHAWVAENGEGVPVVSETVIALVAWLRAKGSAPSFVDAGRRALAAVDAPDDAAERAARGQAWALAEAQGEVAMLRAQVATLTAERDRYREVALTSDSDAENAAEAAADGVLAIGAALGREGATAGECVRLIGRLRVQVAAADREQAALDAVAV